MVLFDLMGHWLGTRQITVTLITRTALSAFYPDEGYFTVTKAILDTQAEHPKTLTAVVLGRTGSEFWN